MQCLSTGGLISWLHSTHLSVTHLKDLQWLHAWLICFCCFGYCSFFFSGMGVAALAFLLLFGCGVVNISWPLQDHSFHLLNVHFVRQVWSILRSYHGLPSPPNQTCERQHQPALERFHAVHCQGSPAGRFVPQRVWQGLLCSRRSVDFTWSNILSEHSELVIQCQLNLYFCSTRVLGSHGNEDIWNHGGNRQYSGTCVETPQTAWGPNRHCWGQVWPSVVPSKPLR